MSTLAAKYPEFWRLLDSMRRDGLMADVEIEICPSAWQDVRNHIAAFADKERTEALAEGRRYADRVRRELGLPSRLEESMGRVRFDLQLDFRKFAASLDKVARATARLQRSLDHAAPTPIYDALVAERGAA